MKKRDLVVGSLWALTVGWLAVNNPSSVWGLAMGTAWAVWAVWDGVVNILNTVAPTATAAFNAPLATAASSAFLANGAMNMIGIENKIARWLGLAGSAVAWFWAGVVTQKFVIGAAAVKWAWDIWKMAWKSDTLRNMWKSTKKEA